MNNRTPSIAIIVEAYGEWGDSDREVAKRIDRANIAIEHDIAQAVAIEREAIAGWHEGERDLCVAMQRDYQLRGLLELTSGAKDAAHFHQQAAQAIRNGEHTKDA